jgi:hypothetical protein
MTRRIAVEFVRNVLQKNPHATDFGTIYDALARTASARSFHNLGYEELSRIGISFSLLSTNALDQLITEVRQSMDIRPQ